MKAVQFLTCQRVAFGSCFKSQLLDTRNGLTLPTALSRLQVVMEWYLNSVSSTSLCMYLILLLYWRGRGEAWPRAVKTFFSSRLIMNSTWLLNSHQRHKFLRAEASRDIVKFRSSEMAFPGIFKRYFPPRTPCRFVRIHVRLERMPSKCSRRSTTSHGSNVSHI